jgi:hypothetical protein
MIAVAAGTILRGRRGGVTAASMPIRSTDPGTSTGTSWAGRCRPSSASSPTSRTCAAPVSCAAAAARSAQHAPWRCAATYNRTCSRARSGAGSAACRSSLHCATAASRTTAWVLCGSGCYGRAHAQARTCRVLTEGYQGHYWTAQTVLQGRYRAGVQRIIGSTMGALIRLVAAGTSG